MQKKRQTFAVDKEPGCLSAWWDLVGVYVTMGFVVISSINTYRRGLQSGDNSAVMSHRVWHVLPNFSYLSYLFGLNRQLFFLAFFETFNLLSFALLFSFHLVPRILLTFHI